VGHVSNVPGRGTLETCPTLVLGTAYANGRAEASRPRFRARFDPERPFRPSHDLYYRRAIEGVE